MRIQTTSQTSPTANRQEEKGESAAPFAPSLLAVVMLTLAVLAGLLAACGGGDSGGAAPAEPQTFAVTVQDEFTFAPDAITVKAGEEVTISFENTGTIPHSLAILAAGVAPEEAAAAGQEGRADLLLMEQSELAAGESGAQTFTAPAKPGEYVFMCAVPGHAQAGMIGTLIVTD